MADYFARAAGNINATNVWSTTPSGTTGNFFPSFTSSDRLMSNGFTVTVNVSTTVGEVRNDTTGGATGGGTFTLSNGVTLTANIFAGLLNIPCVGYAGTTGNSSSIVGNMFGGGVNSANSVLMSGTGTLNITGNATGGFGGAARGIDNTSTGTVNLTGNVTGGSGSSGIGVRNGSSGTFNVTGNVTGGTAIGAENVTTGTMTIVGSAIGSNLAIGAQNSSTGILNVTRAVGNEWGLNTTGANSIVGVNSAVVGSQTRVDEFEVGALGQFPVAGAVSCPDKTSNVFIVHRLGATKKTLSDPAASIGMANQSDVRHGTVYALGTRTGTLRVPSASSVAFGVPVDNTVGTAVLTQSAVWDALVSGMTASGSIGARLKNAATTESIGQNLADALSPV